ncbi:UDP-N-acetylmuramoyl-L-alanyl-D-glutamate--2,6-diaminopimelate ligase [Wenzhouxiangella limi]|uniref:UDP-N-acetylmuramoyl-L-alanyl-D-glutamate--2,6-diaminopimelate ligase n=1 Tax=Wenzhouxiangella limi TaxID=2707351 RepID=A0A845V0S4_9GAMM|nr:UDP-N-acetylmuramoyl-L-alanyl-D-glutamate--2,6-diaminopimelate ligase [Wenzhouxiangella limi]NDY96668.1 UDP-N-acetylmuramoyl-L-alanyl-D-glutamate--2,6-diaminopimelate ligase [Wenzhouxiangella limi]
MSASGLTMQWTELLDGVARPSDQVLLDDLCLDSRHCGPGSVFVALAGEHGHGLEYLDQALAAGVVGVLHDGQRELPHCPVPAVEVPGLADRLPLLARRFFGSPGDMDLVAVTGTNGKTSVAWLLAQALDAAMLGTLGLGRPGAERPGTHTTPDLLSVYRALAALRAEGHKRVVLEASSHALAQDRLAGLAFSCVVFTGLGHDHLDYHADLEAYFEAKARLFSDYPSNRQIINLDDPHGRQLADRLGDREGVLGYSLTNRPSAARLRPLRLDLAGLEVQARLPGADVILRSPLIGRINLHNIAIVALELYARGLKLAEIQARVAALAPVPGRMQVVADGNGRRAIIDYAHTPDALEQALTSLRELGADRIWCVFGCGGERDRAKRPMMGRVAESLADRVILTDDNPRSENGTAIIREIQAGMRHPERSRVLRNRVDAIRIALAECEPGDLVLIAGKGHETVQWIGDQAHAHSDATVVREALEEVA